ncbi:MAG: ATP-binding cassette domain-containing protein [Spirochaetales bacterium]|nr:ATP-binding cassette domain-containing protein [Spirochaetales bacterium]
MALISLQNAGISFGDPPLLENISFQIESCQRICLLGRNGSGKTTLMKILDEQIPPDTGQVLRKKGIRVSYFPQEIPDKLEGTIFDIIAEGLDKDKHDEEWNIHDKVAKILSKITIDKNFIFSHLSGGQKRRVLLAKAFVSEPDLLLLDEPTNHFDIDTISWLEDFLLRLQSSIVFVTHDRMFLKKLATHIIEIDRGTLMSWDCDYDTFLKRKQLLLDNEEKEWKNFDKKLSREEAWIRRGVKARRVRNEGRVRALLKLREQRKNRRQPQGNATISLSLADKSGKLVLEATDISFSYNDKPIINNFCTTIMRGDKIGILGPNGCGKTTLVNLLIKRLPVKSGTIRHGANLSIIYYDQLREQLDENKNVKENVLPNGDTVTVNGKSKHIFSYLEDFLFSTERIKIPARHLSGGERNRLLLARLFTRSSNFLILDEPTNDLDVETLELLEERLVNFEGTLLLICHDRSFLNNVVTSTISFNENNQLVECIGGYDEWLQYKQRQSPLIEKTLSIDKKEMYRKEKKTGQKVKLSFHEAKELTELPSLLQSLEDEQKQLYEKMSDIALYQDKEKIIQAKKRLETIESELTRLYKRWEYLETIEQQDSKK